MFFTSPPWLISSYHRDITEHRVGESLAHWHKLAPTHHRACWINFTSSVLWDTRQLLSSDNEAILTALKRLPQYASKWDEDAEKCVERTALFLKERQRANPKYVRATVFQYGYMSMEKCMDRYTPGYQWLLERVGSGKERRWYRCREEKMC